MIILLTPQNTGTHYIVDFLLKHSKIKRIVSEVDWLYGVGRNKLNRKIPAYKYNQINEKECVLKKHIFGMDSHKISDLLCMAHQCIITFRDPLASIISRKNRNPGESFFFHVDAFEYIATSPYAQKALIIPIDTPEFQQNVSVRFDVGVGILEHCNLGYEDFVYDWATENKHQNSMGDYPEKQAFESGDLNTAISKCKKEYEYLKSKEDVIKPFMKKIGYKSSLWWNND